MKKFFVQQAATVASLLMLVSMLAVEAKAQDEFGEPYWWNYPESTIGVTYIKVNAPGMTNVCVYLPDSLEEGEIDSVYIYCKDPACMKNVRLWAARNPTLITDESIIKTIETPVEGQNAIKLDTPLSIPFQGYMIGYMFDNPAEDGNTYLPRFNKTTSGGFFVFNETYTKGYWTSNSTKAIGNLAIRFHVKTPKWPENSVVVDAQPSDPATTKVGETNAITLTIRNRGVKPVANVGVSIEVNGEKVQKTIPLAKALSGKGVQGTVKVSLPAQNEAGACKVNMQLNKVNGFDNTTMNKHTDFSVEQTFVANSEKRTVVIEEFTGTWCGWCPRGAVAMDLLEKQCGDDYIGIAVHNSDPMELEDYYDVLDHFVDGFPCAAVNRQLANVDPYMGNQSGYPVTFKGTYYYTLGQKHLTEGTVALTADWTDASRTAIKVNTETAFNINRTEAPYRLAFVLTSDNVTGEGEDWLQANYYPGYSSYYPGEDMAAFTAANASNAVVMAYNHVAVACYEPYNGIEGSLNAEVKAGEVQKYSTTLDLSKFPLAQKSAKLKVIALLINSRNHFFVNAAATELENPTAISNASVAPSLQGVARYNVNGMRIDAPVKGLNIMKMNDGSVRKVFVK